MNDTGCWNLIGVAGDKSCDKLAPIVHCRTCDVYAGAAQRSEPLTPPRRPYGRVHVAVSIWGHHVLQVLNVLESSNAG